MNINTLLGEFFCTVDYDSKVIEVDAINWGAHEWREGNRYDNAYQWLNVLDDCLIAESGYDEFEVRFSDELMRELQSIVDEYYETIELLNAIDDERERTADDVWQWSQGEHPLQVPYIGLIHRDFEAVWKDDLGIVRIDYHKSWSPYWSKQFAPLVKRLWRGYMKSGKCLLGDSRTVVKTVWMDEAREFIQS